MIERFIVRTLIIIVCIAIPVGAAIQDNKGIPAKEAGIIKTSPEEKQEIKDCLIRLNLAQTQEERFRAEKEKEAANLQILVMKLQKKYCQDCDLTKDLDLIKPEPKK